MLHEVCGGGIQHIRGEFGVCRCKSAVFMGLTAVVSAKGRTAGVTLSHVEEILVWAA